MGDDLLERPQNSIGIISLLELFVDMLHSLVVGDDFISTITFTSHKELHLVGVCTQLVAIFINILDDLLNYLGTETLATFIRRSQEGAIDQIVGVKEFCVAL
jgi:hypothetical protein